MKKLKNLSESGFLKLFFAFVSLCFLIGAVCMPDRADMLSGFWRILSSPCKISTNYFALGGSAATFLNMAVVGLVCTVLYIALKAQANQVSTLAFLLTLGFCSWGIHVVNMIPSVLGVVLYCALKREKISAHVNTMLFSTGIAPLISELMLRYLTPDAVGFSWGGVLLALAVGLIIGFFLPAGLANGPKVHHGFDLYNAAVYVGMTAFFLQGVLYKAMGVALPAATLEKASSAVIVNAFCGALFGVCVLLALCMGCTPKKYWSLLRDRDCASFSAAHGNAAFLMNVGVYGLFILAYYNLVGADFNGVTFGIIFCMLACCNSGSTPLTVWPIMVGYVAFAALFRWLSGLAGGTFAQAINAQAILVGLCYANGLSPIVRKYGWYYGILAGGLHYCLVTTVPSLHGGFCLYNGGFTAAFVCLLLVPQLQRFCKTKQERLEAKTH